MSKIAYNLRSNINVGLQPSGESTIAELSYLSESGCRLTMTYKLAENIENAASRDAEFWLKLAKAQLRNNVIYAIKSGIGVAIYGLPYTDKGEPTKLANITLSEVLNKTYPNARLRKIASLNIMGASL